MNWETKRIKDVFSFSKGLSITKEDLVEKGVPVISYGQIHSKQNKGVKIDDSLIRFVGEEYLESGEKSLTNKHDFLFADTSEDFEGCGNNVYVDRDMTLFAGYHTIILRNKKPQDCRYFAYQFNSDDWRTQIRKNVCGIKVYSITQKTLSNISLLVPPESIQQKIADFLDAKTQNIDARIEILEKKRERYITLRKALINEAVNVEGKDCTKYRLKDLVFNLVESGKRPVEIEEDVISIGGEHIQNEKFYLENPKYVSFATFEKSKGKIQKDDILVVKDGATIGKCMYVNDMPFDKMLLNEHVYRIQSNKKCNNKFLFYFILSNGDFWFRMNNMTTAQETIKLDTIYTMEINLPNLNEQDKIANYLDKKTSAIDSIIVDISIEIDTLKTYRRALINEAVTGKLKIE